MEEMYMSANHRQHRYLFLLLLLMIVFLSACSTKDHGVGIAADQRALYIGSTKAQVIHIFSPDTGSQIGHYNFTHFRYSGYELSVDGRYLYVYGSREDSILVFDTTTGKEVRRLSIGQGVKHMLICGEQMVLLMNDQQSIQFLQSDGQADGDAVTLSYPVSDIQKASDPRYLYLIHAKTDQVSKLDIEARTIVQTWDTISNPTTVWENHYLNELWVGGHGSIRHIQSGIARYSLADGRYLGEIPSGEMPVRFYPDEQAAALFAVSHGSNHLMKVDVHGHVLAETLTGINPYAIDSDGNSIYVASYDSQVIKVYRIDTLAEKLEFPVSFQPLWLKYRGEVESR